MTHTTGTPDGVPVVCAMFSSGRNGGTGTEAGAKEDGQTMGIRFRRRIRLGKGIQQNLSKSGLGISAGVRGARIGTGPWRLTGALVYRAQECICLAGPQQGRKKVHRLAVDAFSGRSAVRTYRSQMAGSQTDASVSLELVDATYFLKYRDYRRSIRHGQIKRAQRIIDTRPAKIKKASQNDDKRFIRKTACTPDGEVAQKEIYSIDTNVIAAEEIYDGFYLWTSGIFST